MKRLRMLLALGLCALALTTGAACSVAVGGSAVIGRRPQPVSIGQPDPKPCATPSPSLEVSK